MYMVRKKCETEHDGLASPPPLYLPNSRLSAEVATVKFLLLCSEFLKYLYIRYLVKSAQMVSYYAQSCSSYFFFFHKRYLLKLFPCWHAQTYCIPLGTTECSFI